VDGLFGLGNEATPEGLLQFQFQQLLCLHERSGSWPLTPDEPNPNLATLKKRG